MVLTKRNAASGDEIAVTHDHHVITYSLSTHSHPCTESLRKMSSGEHSTLVEGEINFIQTNLREVHFDNDHGYGFLDGTEEQKEELIEKFTALNSTCFVRSRTDVKETSHKTSENGTLTISSFILCFSCH